MASKIEGKAKVIACSDIKVQITPESYSNILKLRTVVLLL